MKPQRGIYSDTSVVFPIILSSPLSLPGVITIYHSSITYKSLGTWKVFGGFFFLLCLKNVALTVSQSTTRYLPFGLKRTLFFFFSCIIFFTATAAMVVTHSAIHLPPPVPIVTAAAAAVHRCSTIIIKRKKKKNPYESLVDPHCCETRPAYSRVKRYIIGVQEISKRFIICARDVVHRARSLLALIFSRAYPRPSPRNLHASHSAVSSRFVRVRCRRYFWIHKLVFLFPSHSLSLFLSQTSQNDLFLQFNLFPFEIKTIHF